MTMTPIDPPDAQVNQLGVKTTATLPVPGWVAITSIILGVLGLLCWGQQGISSLFTDTAALEAAGVQLSPAHRGLAIAGYVVNIVLALWLLTGGLKANAGNQQAASGLLRCWAWVKLASTALGLVVAWAYFDELLKMNEVMFAKAAEASAEKGSAQESLDAFGSDLVERMSIALIVLSGAVQALWPCIVLVVVPRRGDDETIIGHGMESKPL
ncbi:MAG: hypothetical protein MK101_07415 [Phycisphaerales bacterium]|nr:hypothetical protein [Phycisphaerales bacterium]